jgi:hypothetical protein
LNTHHRITVQEQEEWAELIINGFPKEVTIEVPPLDWIASYAEGFHITKIKRSGKPQKEASASKEILVKDEESKTVIAQNYLPNQQPPITMGYQHYQPQHLLSMSSIQGDHYPIYQHDPSFQTIPHP